MKKALNIRVTGRVQGVGYRYFTQDKARILGITGYVRNNYDGSVSVMAQGDQAAIDQFLAFLAKGPAFSHVTCVDKFARDYDDKYQEFKIKL